MSWARFLLIPFCLFYGLAVTVRNKLFDWGLLPSVSFDIPVISVGNLSTGGTGKTPHVEYLIRLLKNDYPLAVLSRGYKRKTRGFVLAGEASTAEEVGDEPLQIKRKFPEVVVAVHERRRKGIARILKEQPQVKAILLDDAFQHRYVKAGMNLLLTEYYFPFFRNFLLPCGTLREPRHQARRADALIVTKTPPVFSPLDRRAILQSLKPYRIKPVMFSSLAYSLWVPVKPGKQAVQQNQVKTVFLFTGIANTSSLEEHLKPFCQELFVTRFPDHHPFSPADLKKLRKSYKESLSRSKILLTTEKDFMRLQDPELLKVFDELPVFYIPVEVVFDKNDGAQFDEMVRAYVDSFFNG
jgi:tetraacyldisaccharide 4'-kinase